MVTYDMAYTVELSLMKLLICIERKKDPETLHVGWW